MKIKYTTLAGQTKEISQEFQQFGMKVLWNAYENARHDHMAVNTVLLNEAHGIMSAVLYGTITKEEA